MKQTPTNIVSSFFYYMWNKWSKEECSIVFGESGISHHIWNKWENLGKSHFKAQRKGSLRSWMMNLVSYWLTGR